MTNQLLGIKIDKTTLSGSLDLIGQWLTEKPQHYVVTPNVEMIIASQQDKYFAQALNGSDLAIPDSARIGWGLQEQAQKGLIMKLIYWPFFLFPTLMPGNDFPITTGTDLMENLIKLSSEKGFRVGLLGGVKNVAIALSERLKAQNPDLKVEFIQENLQVDQNGDHTFFEMENLIGFKQNQAISDAKEQDFYQNLDSRNLDILFVAFGHTKQEKWMLKNLKKTNVKVMLGVGGGI